MQSIEVVIAALKIAGKFINFKYICYQGDLIDNVKERVLLTLTSIWYSKNPSASAVVAMRIRWSKRNTCLGSFLALQLATTLERYSLFVHEERVQEKISVL